MLVLAAHLVSRGQAILCFQERCTIAEAGKGDGHVRLQCIILGSYILASARMDGAYNGQSKVFVYILLSAFRNCWSFSKSAGLSWSQHHKPRCCATLITSDISTAMLHSSHILLPFKYEHASSACIQCFTVLVIKGAHEEWKILSPHDDKQEGQMGVSSSPLMLLPSRCADVSLNV